MPLLDCAPLPHHLADIRARRIAERTIARHGLSLHGLTLYTEASTGLYRYSAALGALAGARQVFATARDSRFGAAEEAVAQCMDAAQAFGVEDRITPSVNRLPQELAQADIITNSGHVRPLDAEIVACLKPTAVIPLMWEPHELRPEELDLAACRECGILVLGTDEEKLGYLPYAGQTVVKMLHDCSLEVVGNKVLVLASGSLAVAIANSLEGAGGAVAWWGAPASVHDPRRIDPDDATTLGHWIDTCDALVCDERHDRSILVGPGGVVATQRLKQRNPGVTIINRHGVIDSQSLQQAGLRLYPEAVLGWGYPTATVAYLGMAPVLELIVAGLAVGAAMARPRLEGLAPGVAARRALDVSFAKDFDAPWQWVEDLA